MPCLLWATTRLRKRTVGVTTDVRSSQYDRTTQHVRFVCMQRINLLGVYILKRGMQSDCTRDVRCAYRIKLKDESMRNRPANTPVHTQP